MLFHYPPHVYFCLCLLFLDLSASSFHLHKPDLRGSGLSWKHHHSISSLALIYCHYCIPVISARSYITCDWFPNSMYLRDFSCSTIGLTSRTFSHPARVVFLWISNLTFWVVFHYTFDLRESLENDNSKWMWQWCSGIVFICLYIDINTYLMYISQIKLMEFVQIHACL